MLVGEWQGGWIWYSASVVWTMLVGEWQGGWIRYSVSVVHYVYGECDQSKHWK